jgi:hypothetical protein
MPRFLCKCDGFPIWIEFSSPSPLLQEGLQPQTVLARGLVAAREPIGDILPRYANQLGYLLRRGRLKNLRDSFARAADHDFVQAMGDQIEHGQVRLSRGVSFPVR